ncbi:hypothetical protein FQN54_003018 [Arachnomyces sp. PD_36]|nr:hypothetical protein FQN54_003018 [Arachnomyces sp. PD_36]
MRFRLPDAGDSDDGRSYLPNPRLGPFLGLFEAQEPTYHSVRDVWYNLIREAAIPPGCGLEWASFWGTSPSHDFPGRYWALKVEPHGHRYGPCRPMPLLVVGYKQLPSLSADEPRVVPINDWSFAEIMENPDAPLGSPYWDYLKEAAGIHVRALFQVNEPIPQYVALAVGRFVQFLKLVYTATGPRIIGMVDSPVYDIVNETYDVLRVLTHINQGREVITM